MSGRDAGRLRSIEQGLDTQEIMLLWLEEARQYDSLAELVHSLQGQPERTYPLYVLAEKAETRSAIGSHRRHPPKYTRGSGTQFATLRPSITCSSS